MVFSVSLILAGIETTASSARKHLNAACQVSTTALLFVAMTERKMSSVHDMELVSDGDGGLRIVNITHPVGVILRVPNIGWKPKSKTILGCMNIYA